MDARSVKCIEFNDCFFAKSFQASVPQTAPARLACSNRKTALQYSPHRDRRGKGGSGGNREHEPKATNLCNKFKIQTGASPPVKPFHSFGPGRLLWKRCFGPSAQMPIFWSHPVPCKTGRVLGAFSAGLSNRSILLTCPSLPLGHLPDGCLNIRIAIPGSQGFSAPAWHSPQKFRGPCGGRFNCWCRSDGPDGRRYGPR